MAQMLLQAGLNVEIHTNHFPKDCPDDVWIPDCARRGWLIVTADKRIERDPVIAAAAIAAHARVLMLDDNNCRAAWWAAAIIVSRDSIFDQLLRETQACILPLRKQANLTGQLRPFPQVRTPGLH